MRYITLFEHEYIAPGNVVTKAHTLASKEIMETDQTDEELLENCDKILAAVKASDPTITRMIIFKELTR